MELITQKECPICREPITTLTGITTSTCRHSFCFKCTIRLLYHDNLLCPICRSDWNNLLADDEIEISPQQITLWSAVKNAVVTCKNKLFEIARLPEVTIIKWPTTFMILCIIGSRLATYVDDLTHHIPHDNKIIVMELILLTSMSYLLYEINKKKVCLTCIRANRL